MGRYKKAYAERLVSKYVDEIEREKKQIIKNFQDMDLDNADVKNDFALIVNSMVQKCDSLISEISSYSFD
ncbi:MULTISPECIES: hypothetical protein [Clostridium]|uniref:Uncharacterized protein n=1 Tax=Clostridium cibarium TaxID=2762247 RepID=A0ABR8PUJ8_9CLOT|nr:MULTISPECIES: hypothetical protein [Clostridium]MBD7911800.1 hypothetical protein [Clostridium cibarium]